MKRNEDEEMQESEEEASSGEPDTEAFEREYLLDRSYEFLPEDEEGRLLPQDPTEEQRSQRKRIAEHYKTAGVKRGLIRFTLLVLDASEAAAWDDPEFKPNRFTVLVHSAKEFIRAFFDQNPLSQIGVVLLRNGRSEILSPLSASPVRVFCLESVRSFDGHVFVQEAHVRKLSGNFDLGGNVSLQNGLEQALDVLKSVPGHGHREAVFMLSAVATCDPGNIFQTIQKLKDESVRVTVVGMVAHVHVRKFIADETKGKYFIPMSERHLTECLMELVPAPAALLNAAKPTLVRMGFPEKNPDGPRGVAFEGAESLLTGGGYTCNRCKARVAELPCQCHGCGLTLVSAPQLARSYHHLFPVQPFTEVIPSPEDTGECYGCLSALKSSEGIVSRCPKCRSLFCFSCDIYIHEVLHNCPKCELL